MCKSSLNQSLTPAISIDPKRIKDSLGLSSRVLPVRYPVVVVLLNLTDLPAWPVRCSVLSLRANECPYGFGHRLHLTIPSRDNPFGRE